MELRAYIAQRRKTLGLTQTDIAKALGYSETALNKIELGASLPPISILPSLADQLQLSLNDLLLMKKPERFVSGSAPYYGDSSSNSFSSNSATSGGASTSTDPLTVVSSLPVTGLDEFVVVGSDGGSNEEAMKRPTAADPTTQYTMNLYTGLNLGPAERQNIEFRFSIINALTFPFWEESL